MGDPVTQAQFYEAVRKLDETMHAHHKSQREHIDRRYAAIEDIFRDHEKEDQAIALRVTVIETERLGEQRVAARRGTWAGLAAAAGFSLVSEFLKHTFGWPKA